MLVCVRLLEVDKVLAGALQQSVDVEHVDSRLRVFRRHSLRNERRTQQVGKANSGRARAKEQVFLVLKLRTLDLGRVDHAGKCDAGSALHVVIIDAVLVAVSLEQMHSVRPRPILEMNAAFREHLLHGLNELIHEGKELVGRWAGLAHAQIKRIVQVLLIVGTGIEIHGEQVLRWHARAGGVQLQLADWDTGAVSPEVSETENAAAVRDTNKPNVLLRPVFQDVLDLAPARHRAIDAARLPVYVAKLKASFANRRV